MSVERFALVVNRLCGIVLWTAQDGDSAIVWCEDQGDLAFALNLRDAAEAAPLPGDLVSFRIAMRDGMRVATAVSILEQKYSPELIQKLQRLEKGPAGEAALPGVVREGAKGPAAGPAVAAGKISVGEMEQASVILTFPKQQTSPSRDADFRSFG